MAAYLAFLLLPSLALAMDADSPVAKALEADDACSPGDERCDLTMLQLRSRQQSQDLAVRLAANATSNATETEHERSGVIMTLYHQTSESAGNSILRHGFNRGSPKGWCGSAIYFSPTAHETNIKALGGRGFIIEAVVNLGRILHEGPYCDRSMNEHKLKAMGYDSITLDRGRIAECKYLAHCYEYVIYDRNQIVSMKGYKWHGTKHWWDPNAALSPMDGEAGIPDDAPLELDPNAIIDDCR